MVKKKTKNEDTEADIDIDLDDLDDLGEMDFGDESGIDDDNREPSRAKVMTDLGRQAGEGALESLIKNTAKKSLPDEYDSSYYDVMDIASFTSEVVDKNKSALNKSAYKLGKEVKKILPFKMSLLDKYLESQESDFETSRTQSEEEMRNAGIGSELGGIFDKQLEMQKAVLARDEAKEEVEQRQTLIQNKLSNDVLSNMDGNIAHQTAFTTQISKEYYRRSLELQFKSYYIQADSLKTMREHYKAFAIQFTNIEKNTSLPDFVKLRNTEALKEIMRQQTVESVHKKLFTNSKYMEAMKKKLGGYVQEKVSNVTNSMDEATNALDMMNSSGEAGGGLKMLGDLLASMGGATLGENIADKFGPKIKEKIKDNKLINTGANKLGVFSNSPSSFVENLKDSTGKKVQEYEDASTPGSWFGKGFNSILNNILTVATPGAESLEVKNKGYLTHNQAAIFDNKVHRSITEVIPLFLSRILQINTKLTSMYTAKNKIKGSHDVEALVYDYEGRGLTTAGTLRDNIKKSVFKQKSDADKAEGVSTSILQDAASGVGNSTELDVKGKKELQKQLRDKGNMKILSKYIADGTKALGGKGDYDTLMISYDTDPKLKALLELDENKKAKELLEITKKYRSADSGHIRQRVADFNRVYPVEGVKNLFKQISVIARAPSPVILDNQQAEAIAKNLINYQQITGRDFTMESFMAKQQHAFMYFQNGSLTSEIQNIINVTIADLTKIYNNEDSLTRSSVELMFANANNSLRNTDEFSVSVYENLEDLVGNLIGKGTRGNFNPNGRTLNAENTREGSLVLGGVGSYDNADGIVFGGKLKGQELAEARRGVDASNEAGWINQLSEGIRQNKDRLKQIYSDNKNNPVAMARELAKMGTEVKTSVTDKLNKQRAELTASINDFLVENDLTPEAIANKGVKVVSDKFAKKIADMEAMIVTMERDMQERQAKLAELQSITSDAVSNRNAEAQMVKMTQQYNKAAKNSIELLRKTVGVLKAQKLKVDSIDSTKINEVLPGVIASFKETIAKMKDNIAEYERVGKDLFGQT